MRISEPIGSDSDIDMVEIEEEEINSTTTTIKMTTTTTLTTLTTTSNKNQTSSKMASFTAKLSSSNNERSRLSRDELETYEKKMTNFTDHTFKAIFTLIAVILLLTAIIMFLIFKNR